MHDLVPMLTEAEFIIALGILILLPALIVAFLSYHAQDGDGADEDELPEGVTVLDGFDLDADDEVQLAELDQPDMKTARWGWLQQIWRMHKQIKKRRKMASEGYVQWYLIDDTYPVPKFVKPERKGAGVPEYEHGGNRYLFPKDAMVASEQQGVWTIMHKRGEADPLNLRDPTKNAIQADTLEEYIQMRVSTSPPSWLDQFGLGAEDIIKYGLAGFILIVIGQSVIGGGIGL